MRCLQVMLALVLMSHSYAQARNGQDLSALRAAAQRFVAGQVASAYPDARADVGIGPIDPRLNLPNCPEPIFNLSPGSNLWGAGNLGVDCAAPTAWSLYLTYRISLKGPALLASRPLAAGEALGPGNVVEGIVEYGSDPGRYPRDLTRLRGATLARPLAKNSPITIEMLRLQAIVKAGQRVRMQVDGNGFRVSQEGIAQSQAGIGDSLRLKTPSGRYVQGIVQPDGSVRIAP